MFLLPRLFLLAIAAFSVLTLVSCKEDDGASSSSKPTISSMTPGEVFPGQTNVKGTIMGTNFTGFGAVNLGPGIEILKTKLISSTEITVRFTVQSDAPSGPRTVSVSTLAGTGELNGAFSIAENRPPQASFAADPQNANKGVEITFNASASNDPDGTINLYQWDFGDGANSEGKIVKHTYNSSGNFTVTLTVTDDRASKTTTTREHKY